MALKTQIKTLRAHKLAALLVDARLYARRTPEEACALLNWEIEHLEDLEIAAIPPTLPELEALAAIYAVPVDHFFGNTSLSDGMPRLRTETMTQRLELRNRILGAMIMQARLRRNFSRDDLSYATNIPLEQIIEYELGQVPIPVTDLEDITRMMQIDITDWIDSYAIPTRDMIFRPYKIGDISSQTTSAADSRQETVENEEITEKPAVLPTEEDQSSKNQPAAVEVQPEVVAISVAVVEPEKISKPEPEAVVIPAEPTTQTAAEEKTQKVEPKKITEAPSSNTDLDILLSSDLPQELKDFIANPINRQYLLLANNLSRMPADQLRRIAESLLDITY